MAQNSLLKIQGLYSFPNHLSANPTGALLKAKNIVVDRESVAESRRGHKLYGNAMGLSNSLTAHQLLTYKGRILRHFGNGTGTTLQFDDGTGTFSAFSGNVSEVELGRRIRSVEQNGNLYFTTDEGIKKISVDSAAGLDTAEITQAGGIKALDFTASVASGPGFFKSANNVATTGTTNNGSMSGTIIDISVANPTIVTSVNHRLFTGDSISITGSNSTPSIDGTYEITVLDNNSFSLPISVTTSGTAGSWTFSGHANIIYNIPDTSIFTLGYFITGTGIPSGTTIKSVLDGNTISISNSASISNTGVSLHSATNAVLGYRVLWGIKDVNKNLILGTPSQRVVVYNTDISGNSELVALSITIPKEVTTNHFYQVYRTAVFDDPVTLNIHQDPGDEMQLVYEANPLSADLTAGFVNFTDIEPELSRESGANLYTNQNSGEGILQANDRPYLAKDMTSFKGYTFYANTTSLQTLSLTLLGVVEMVSNTSTLTITDGITPTVYTFRSAADGGEDITTRHILFSPVPPGTLSPSQQIEQTSRSLVRVINRQSSEIVQAEYLSSPTGSPGLLSFVARKLNQAPFYLTVNDAVTTGVEFDPALPVSGNKVTSTSEVQPNRVYFSKFQQPEAVPILNYLDIGPQDKAILRILALRDNLFVLKEDGVYRLSGLTSPFSVYPFDFSVVIKAPDSAVILNNLIYLYSSQGIGTISDTGIAVISRPIEDDIVKLLIPNYTNFASATFGVAYETDRSYYLFTVTNTTDAYATQCFRYNTFTNTWTKLDLSKRCGVVNTSDDKLYLGPTDVCYLEQERKSFSRTDFSDREISFDLGSSAIQGTTINVPSVRGISAGDVLTQVQYLTIRQFNRLLTKLDRDNMLAFPTYSTSFGAVPGVDLSSSITDLINQLAVDSGRLSTPTAHPASNYTNLLPIPSDFAAQQTKFNAVVGLLNTDDGTAYKNYVSVSGAVEYEFVVLAVDSQLNTITAPYVYPLLEGPVTIYNHINVELQWTPQYLQDVSMTKHVSEGTLIFEDSSFTTATLSYASDLSANFENQDINGFGNGIFGNSPYGEGLYGGNGSGIPFRTFIPREKQRCRYLNIKFTHSIAREVFSLYGLSLTYNPVSQRGYR